MTEHTITCIYCKHSFDVKIPAEIEKRKEACGYTMFKARCVKCTKLFVVRLPVGAEPMDRPKPFVPFHPPGDHRSRPHMHPHEPVPRRPPALKNVKPEPEPEAVEIPAECITEVIEPGTLGKPQIRPSDKRRRRRRFAVDQPVEVEKKPGFLTGTKFAACLLVIVFFLGLANSITNLTYATELASSDDLGSESSITTMTVSGSVIDYYTTFPIANAQVSVDGTGRSAITNGEGFYVLDGVPTGEQTITVTASGYTGVSKKVILSPAPEKIIDFELKHGTGTDSIDDTSSDSRDELEDDENDQGAWNLTGMLMLVFAILAAISAYLAFSKILFWICAPTAFLGALSFGFGFGLILGLIALILILSSKNTFREMEEKEKER